MNRREFADVIDENFPRIHRAALILTGNPWDADDLAQETFLTAARIWSRFLGRSQVYTWLYGILLNLERRERRRLGTRRRKLRVLWDQRSRTEPTDPPAEAVLEATQWKRSLWARVAELPDGQRHVLILRFSEQLSYQEIADVMRCPLGTVKSRIFHGLSNLRRALREQDGELYLPPTVPSADLFRAL